MTKTPPNPHDQVDRTAEQTGEGAIIAPAPKKGGVTYHGTLPDDDPIYKGGWNFLSGKNLKPAKPD
jgi:hypothetical protein